MGEGVFGTITPRTIALALLSYAADKLREKLEPPPCIAEAIHHFAAEVAVHTIELAAAEELSAAWAWVRSHPPPATGSPFDDAPTPPTPAPIAYDPIPADDRVRDG